MQSKIENLERLDVRIKSLRVRLDVLTTNPPVCYNNKVLKMNLQNDISHIKSQLQIAGEAWNSQLESMKYQ